MLPSASTQRDRLGGVGGREADTSSIPQLGRAFGAMMTSYRKGRSSKCGHRDRLPRQVNEVSSSAAEE